MQNKLVQKELESTALLRKCSNYLEAESLLTTSTRGYIDTPMLRNATTGPNAVDPERADGGVSAVALRRMGKPEEVAKLIAFLLSDESSFITGANISIDGGWNC